MTTERCEIRRCRAESGITYLDHGVCERHWNELNAEEVPSDALRIALGIEATPTATEDSTMSPTTVKTAKKSSKTSAKPKEPKPKKEKAAKEPQVVFAFRLREADRDLIHRAAGPGKASQFAKTILIKEAQKALQANS